MFFKKKDLFIWTIIISISVFLRFYGLGDFSLSSDEIFQAIETDPANSPQELLDLAARHQQSPIYYLILQLFQRVFGKSEFAIRLPSAIFGILAVPFIYILGRSIFCKNVGLYSSILLSVSLLGIKISQFARPYSLFLLFSMAQLYFFNIVLKNERLKDYILLLISNIFLFYTHPFTIFIIGIELIFCSLFLIKKDSRVFLKIFIVNILSILLFLPYLRVLLYYMQHWAPNLEAKFMILSYLLRESSRTFIEFGKPLSVVYFILFLVGISFYFRRKSMEAIFLLFFFVILTTFLLIIFLYKGVNFQIKYITFLLPIYLIGVACGIESLFSSIEKYFYRNCRIMSIFILIAFLGVGFFYFKELSLYYRYSDKEDWKALGDYLNRIVIEREKLFFLPGWIEFNYEFYRRKNNIKTSSSSSAKYTWLVTAYGKRPEDFELQNRRWELAERFSGNIQLWRAEHLK